MYIDTLRDVRLGVRSRTVNVSAGWHAVQLIATTAQGPETHTTQSRTASPTLTS